MSTTRSTRADRCILATLAVVFGASVVACGDSSNATERAPSSATPVDGSLRASSIAIGDCTDGVTEVPAAFDGTGTLGDLGTAVFHIDATATCQPGQLGALNKVTGTYTLANGDTLTFAGGESPLTHDSSTSLVTFEIRNQFNGGTGKFEGASGTQSIVGTHSLATNELTMEITGNTNITP